ncbi:N-acetyl-gamma-glutamyl-phosphate reductase [Aquabacterium sp.]|uniref:N-acetyl-gamma-glutamyl-phosphate reductase n=1 Tax=Aquabacterium sp. TaxID=1872578 RepID=UPI003783D369
MSTTVFVDGDQGTTGLQIVGQLAARRDLQLLTLPAAQRKDPLRRADALNRCDVAILCLPDAAAREAAAMIENPAVRVIDASSAHRTDASWVYGFPEMSAGQADAIRAARRISNPGCYPTGAVALLRPLVTAGLLPADYPLAIHAISGYSGQGRAGVQAHEGPQAGSAPALEVYGLALQHKHVPEIRQHALLTERPGFVPAYGAYRQGIVLTIALQQRLLPSEASGQRLQEALATHYAGAQHVRVLPRADAAALTGLNPQQHNGSNTMSLAVFENATHGQLLLAAVFDNLGKGASGAALQNLDLLLGADQ